MSKEKIYDGNIDDSLYLLVLLYIYSSPGSHVNYSYYGFSHQVYYYYPFSVVSDPAKLYNDLRWNITRPQGFEAVMRVRCSQVFLRRNDILILFSLNDLCLGTYMCSVNETNVLPCV